MGVKNLQGYFEKYGSDPPDPYFYRVAVRDLLIPGRKDTLIIDMNSCQNKFVSGLDLVCGGQFRQYKERWAEFVNKLSDLGVKVIFVTDGPTVTEKRDVWVQRR